MYVCMYVCIYVCMYVCMYVSIYLSIYLSVYLSIYLSILPILTICVYIQSGCAYKVVLCICTKWYRGLKLTKSKKLIQSCFEDGFRMHLIHQGSKVVA